MLGFGETEFEAIALSLKVALTASLLSLVPAIAVSYWLARSQSALSGIVSAVVHLPLVVPPVVTGYALLIVFSPNGWVGSFLENTIGLEIAFRWTGAALAAAIMAFPLLVRPLRLAFEAVDPGLEQAAGSLGANRWRVFATISLPLAMPGLIAGLVLAFAKALGEFGATITFVSNIPGETQTLALAIYSFLQSPTGDEAALRLVLLSIALSVCAVLLSEWLSMRIARRSRAA
ncbi:MAG: molybdate ABC transporter permease subunit [Pseudomonadota bacterium]